MYLSNQPEFAEDGQGASENAIKALMKYGIDLSGHRTQPVTEGPYKAMRFNPNNDRGTLSKY